VIRFFTLIRSDIIGSEKSRSGLTLPLDDQANTELSVYRSVFRVLDKGNAAVVLMLFLFLFLFLVLLS
jgi:hypothetical protein